MINKKRKTKMKAKYYKDVIPRYKGNPLAEAFIGSLPNPHATHSEIYDLIRKEPDYDESYRTLPAQKRRDLVENLDDFVEPLSRYMDLYDELIRKVKEGYHGRNPFDPIWREYLNNLAQGKESKIPTGTNSTITGFTIIGESGMGKTTAIEEILSLLPQIIVHSKYKKRALSQFQIVWVRIECPEDKNTRSLCLEFLDAIDNILRNSNYYKKHIDAKESELVITIRQIAAELGIGVFIIDEIQRLNRAKSGGDKKMLDFFVNLSNTIGLPIILVGTPDTKEVISDKIAMVRRFAPRNWKSLDDSEFKTFLENLWQYQYTKQKTELTPELISTISDLTRQVTGSIVDLFKETQLEIIGNGEDELITSEILTYVMETKLEGIHEINKAIKNPKPEKHKERLAAISDLPSDVLNPNNSNSALSRDKIAESLIAVPYSREIAYHYADRVINEHPGTDISILITKALLLAANPEKNQENSHTPARDNKNFPSKKKSSKKKNSADISLLPPSDPRRIVEEGNKNNLSGYESLKKVGLIKSPKEFPL